MNWSQPARGRGCAGNWRWKRTGNLAADSSTRCLCVSVSVSVLADARPRLAGERAEPAGASAAATISAEPLQSPGFRKERGSACSFSLRVPAKNVAAHAASVSGFPHRTWQRMHLQSPGFRKEHDSACTFILRVSAKNVAAHAASVSGFPQRTWQREPRQSPGFRKEHGRQRMQLLSPGFRKERGSACSSISGFPQRTWQRMQLYCSIRVSAKNVAAHAASLQYPGFRKERGSACGFNLRVSAKNVAAHALVLVTRRRRYNSEENSVTRFPQGTWQLLMHALASVPRCLR